MDIDDKKLENLKDKVIELLSYNNIAEFDKLLNNELTPFYLFYDHYHPTHIQYKNYSSIFTKICQVGNFNFVKSALKKSSFNHENNYLRGIATASGFIKACTYNHIEVVKYLVEFDKKYQHIIGEDNGINHRILSKQFGKAVITHDVLESGLTNALYNFEPNMDLIEYLFLSHELKNHPKTKFEDLITVFMLDKLDLFDKLLVKALNEEFDILDLFKTSSLSLPDEKESLFKLAKHLIHNFKIYNYPEVEEKIAKEPILSQVYLAEQLINNLLIQDDKISAKRLKI
jgi:sulfur relay (sulfurtransferase) DsrF/TusC family protein